MPWRSPFFSAALSCNSLLRAIPQNTEKSPAAQELHGCVVVLDGRHPACVLRLALQSLSSFPFFSLFLGIALVVLYAALSYHIALISARMSGWDRRAGGRSLSRSLTAALFPLTRQLKACLSKGDRKGGDALCRRGYGVHGVEKGEALRCQIEVLGIEAAAQTFPPPLMVSGDARLFLLFNLLGRPRQQLPLPGAAGGAGGSPSAGPRCPPGG